MCALSCNEEKRHCKRGQVEIDAIISNNTIYDTQRNWSYSEIQAARSTTRASDGGDDSGGDGGGDVVAGARCNDV